MKEMGKQVEKSDDGSQSPSNSEKSPRESTAVAEKSENGDDQILEETVTDMEREAVDLQNDNETPQQASEASDAEKASNGTSSGVNTPIKV